MRTTRFRLLAVFFFFFSIVWQLGTLKAQCSLRCTDGYDSNNSSDIFIEAGSTVCISSGVECSGHVFLNGGVLCNSGNIFNLQVKGSGIIYNYGKIEVQDQDVMIDQVTLYNYQGAMFVFSDECFIRMNVESIFEIINSGGALVNFARDVNVNSGTMLIDNGYSSEQSTSNVISVINMAGVSFNDANLSIKNGTSAIMNIGGSININNGRALNTFLNTGIINIYGSLNVSMYSASDGSLAIENDGTFSAESDLRLSTALAQVSLLNSSSGGSQSALPKLEVFGNTQVDGENLQITNLGEMNFGAPLLMYKGKIENQCKFKCLDFTIVQGFFENGSVDTVDGVAYQSQYNFGKGAIAEIQNMSFYNGVLENAGSINVIANVFMSGGTLTNHKTFRASSLTMNGGVFSNDDYVGISGNTSFSLSAVYNNNRRTEIAGVVLNSGKLNLGRQTSFATLSLNNSLNGIIEGPTTIEDSTKYAIVFVKEISTNSGRIRNHTCFVDLSYSGNARIRIDNQQGNTTWVESPPVMFYLTGGIRGPGGSTSCPYEVYFTPNSGINLCQNTAISFVASISYMSSNLSVLVPATNPFVWTANPPQASAATGGLLNSVYTHPAVQNPFGLSVSTNYGGCPLTNTAVTIDVQDLFADAGSTKFIVQGGSTQIGGQPSAYGSSSSTPPYTYMWSPNGTFVAPSTTNSPNPIVSPSVSTTYQLLVTSPSSGCVAKSNMTVIVEQIPHAVLRRVIDGGYYKVVTNNSIYFKYEDEYGVSGNLSYRIYKQDHTSSLPAYACSGLTPIYGDNRFSINLSIGCSPSIAPSNPCVFYVLEVLNEKNEKYFLKFLY